MVTKKTKQPGCGEMVERVARAIYASTWVFDDNPGASALEWPGGIAGDRYRQFARAAIEAMRDLTDAMVSALLREKFLPNNEHERDVVTLDWQVMIDEALKPLATAGLCEPETPASNTD